jgi:hypothetical protein
MRLAASVGVSVEREVRVVLRSVRSASVAIQAVERAEVAATRTPRRTPRRVQAASWTRISGSSFSNRYSDVTTSSIAERGHAHDYFGMFAKRE